MLNIENKIITIVGAKKSGIALARLISQLKGVPKITEVGDEQCLFEHTREWKLPKSISIEFNGHTQDFIKDSDIVVLSPGVSLDSEPVKWANAFGIPVLGEVEFASQFCPIPIIAVTGSNGKTTVSTLIYEVLKQEGYEVSLCGNIGRPFSEFVLELEDKDFVVLEISSFQMESVQNSQIVKDLSINGFKPNIGVFLNFSENHLDRHEDLDEYFSAKKKLFTNQEEDDFAVLNFKDKRVCSLKDSLKSQIRYFNTSENTEDDLNQLAVLEVAKILNITQEICLEVFKKFKGVEHRLEWVRDLKGVEFINDSKATTAEASRWALEHINKPIVMICGGRDKNIDFSVLSDIVKEKVKKMIVIGEAKEKLVDAFSDIVKIEQCEKLEQAVLLAEKSADKGDCVVLSPMCTSFDMFGDFQERGEIYKDIVKSLK